MEKDTTTYQKVEVERDIILKKLRERGCRITRQRLNLIDTILENECTSCKQIFYKASAQDKTLGIATVYRMVNLLEEIGVISRKNMYSVDCREDVDIDGVCSIVLDDGTIYHLSEKKWNSVIKAGLRSQGYLTKQKLVSVAIKGQAALASGMRQP